MLLGEVLIVGVFVAALLSAMGCFAYLVYATLLERHLLRARPAHVRVGARAIVPPTTTTPDRMRRVPGNVALPVGKR